MNRVLVVDDDAGMRSALEARFLRRGWRVDTACKASEALEKFRRGMHPLIVTDIRMPGEDGFFVMRSARALAPHTAVILLTAYASVPDAVVAMKDGACDYLVKPVAFEQLEAAAERILARATSQAGALKELGGHSPVWLRALERARQAAACDADILIGRKRYRQGVSSADDSSPEPAPRPSFCCSELRRFPGNTARK